MPTRAEPGNKPGEGLYDTKRDTKTDYIAMMEQSIRDHVKNGELKPGDKWAAFPEIQNWGIEGVNCGAPQTCYFKSNQEFNSYVRKMVQSARETLKEQGLENQVDVVCCGFDMYIVTGNNNEDRRKMAEQNPQAASFRLYLQTRVFHDAPVSRS